MLKLKEIANIGWKDFVAKYYNNGERNSGD